MNHRAMGIACLVVGIGVLMALIALLTQLIGRAEMLVPWQEFEPSDVIALYWNGIKFMGAMLGIGFACGIAVALGISELRRVNAKKH